MKTYAKNLKSDLGDWLNTAFMDKPLTFTVAITSLVIFFAAALVLAIDVVAALWPYLWWLFVAGTAVAVGAKVFLVWSDFRSYRVQARMNRSNT